MKAPLLFLLIPVIFACTFYTLDAQRLRLRSSKPQAFFPLEIKNDAAASRNGTTTFLLFTGKTIEKKPKSGVLTFIKNNGAYWGTLTPLTADSKAGDFSIRLDTMVALRGSNTVLLMIPTLQSGRTMVSINNPLCMSTVGDSTGFVFQEPDISNTADPSYNYLFDKFEYTYDASGHFYINPTAVDFYSIPMHINTLSNSQHSGSPMGAARAALLKTIADTLTAGDKTTDKSWRKCLIMDPASRTILRIAAPSVAPGFNADYLSDTSRGHFNYINNLISYYDKDTVVIDCSELGDSTMEVFDHYQKTFQQDTGAYYFTGSINSSNHFVFTNAPKRSTGAPMSVSINMDSITSADFFAPGNGQFSTPNKTVQSIIVKYLTSAFSVGLLPAANRDTFSKPWFPAHRSDYYQENPRNGPQTTGSGPWYSLYSKAIHAALGESMYAFAYDDVLGQDGTLVCTNKDTIRVTIGDLGKINLPVRSCRAPVFTIDAATMTVDSMLCKNNKCTITAHWKVPAGQPSNAQYYLMFGAGNFKVPSDNIVANQLAQGALPSFSATSATLCFNQDEWLNVGHPGTDITIKVMTCGGPVSECPTIGNINQNGQGSRLVPQTQAGTDPKKCLPH